MILFYFLNIKNSFRDLGIIFHWTVVLFLVLQAIYLHFRFPFHKFIWNILLCISWFRIIVIPVRPCICHGFTMVLRIYIIVWLHIVLRASNGKCLFSLIRGNHCEWALKGAVGEIHYRRELSFFCWWSFSDFFLVRGILFANKFSFF